MRCSSHALVIENADGSGAQLPAPEAATSLSKRDLGEDVVAQHSAGVGPAPHLCAIRTNSKTAARQTKLGPSPR